MGLGSLIFDIYFDGFLTENHLWSHYHNEPLQRFSWDSQFAYFVNFVKAHSVPEIRYFRSFLHKKHTLSLLQVKMKNSFVQDVQTYFREYCTYTTVHGFQYFGEKRTIFEK
jgi:hypothetical protein